MNISELTQQQMKEILLYAYNKGNDESEDIGVKEMVEEIKRQIVSAVGGNRT